MPTLSQGHTAIPSWKYGTIPVHFSVPHILQHMSVNPHLLIEPQQIKTNVDKGPQECCCNYSNTQGGEQPCKVSPTFFGGGGCITWSWGVLLCDMCTSVLNPKPLPYRTALTEPLMNVQPLLMQKKPKRKRQPETNKRENWRWADAQDKMAGQVPSFHTGFKQKDFTQKHGSDGSDFSFFFSVCS